ncbi:MAG: hypothetical protein HY276_12355, partial [Ignavibacteriales bacterium]|nr:hypothetical protein [Ignavibacteriales bacterium]
MKSLSYIIVVISISALLTGCGNDNGEIGNYRYRSDMYEQPSFKRQEDPREPVKGTIPVNGYEAPLKDSLTAAKLVNPVRWSTANADSGKFLFETYCSP